MGRAVLGAAGVDEQVLSWAAVADAVGVAAVDIDLTVRMLPGKFQQDVAHGFTRKMRHPVVIG